MTLPTYVLPFFSLISDSLGSVSHNQGKCGHNYLEPIVPKNTRVPNKKKVHTYHFVQKVQQIIHLSRQIIHLSSLVNNS